MSYKSKTAGHQYNICFYHMYHLYILMYDTLINNFYLLTIVYGDSDLDSCNIERKHDCLWR